MLRSVYIHTQTREPNFRWILTDVDMKSDLFYPCRSSVICLIIFQVKMETINILFFSVIERNTECSIFKYINIMYGRHIMPHVCSDVVNPKPVKYNKINLLSSAGVTYQHFFFIASTGSRGRWPWSTWITPLLKHGSFTLRNATFDL